MTKIRYDVIGRQQQPRYITVYMHQFLSQHGIQNNVIWFKEF
jgi:hypothetical protein